MYSHCGTRQNRESTEEYSKSIVRNNNDKFGKGLAPTSRFQAKITTYTVFIQRHLDTRVETRCPWRVSISCMTSRSRHFSYSDIEFYFQVLLNCSLYHAKKSLSVYLYFNLLFQIITSLWSRSALDNLSEFELVTIVITDYVKHYHTG